jgi:hypothetical protein
MHRTACAGGEGGSLLRCPSCDRPVAAERVCWPCCDRLCRVCGGQTGSAFIDVCWSCWFRGADDPAPGPDAAVSGSA